MRTIANTGNAVTRTTTAIGVRAVGPASRQRWRKAPGARTRRARRGPPHFVRRCTQPSHDGLAPGGALLPLRHHRRLEIMSRSKCPKCQVDLRSCVQCVNFDPGRKLRVRGKAYGSCVTEGRGQRLPALLGPHHLGARNHHGRGPEQSERAIGAKKAFDDLFKF